MDIPITDAIITNNDLRMDLEFKYIKAKLLYEKNIYLNIKLEKMVNMIVNIKKVIRYLKLFLKI